MYSKLRMLDSVLKGHYYFGLDKRIPVFVFANNKGADQPAQINRLIGAFVIS